MRLVRWKPQLPSAWKDRELPVAVQRGNQSVARPWVLTLEHDLLQENEACLLVQPPCFGSQAQRGRHQVCTAAFLSQKDDQSPLVKCLGNTAVELPFESELVWGVRFWLSVTCGYRGVRFTVGWSSLRRSARGSVHTHLCTNMYVYNVYNVVWNILEGYTVERSRLL